MRKKVLVRANTRKIYKKFEEKIRFKKKPKAVVKLNLKPDLRTDYSFLVII